MITWSEEPLSGTGPTLVLLYGTPGIPQVRRPLDRDAILIGRSRGCDLVLEAPDVSSPHCVVSRGTGGYTVRDCCSRAGTRLNGDPVQEATLHDGDLLQVGVFSFRVELPPLRRAASEPPSEPPHVRLERKRRNLVRLALAQRKRLRQLQRSGRRAAPAPVLQEADLCAQASSLHERVRQYEQRCIQLEYDEQALRRDRAAFDEEEAAFEERMAAFEQELARRQAEREAETARPARELAELPEEVERCREEDVPPCRCQAELPGDLEEARRLHIRRQELEFYGRYLQRSRDHLLEQKQQLERGHQHLKRGLLEMEVEHKQTMLAREDWLHEQAEVTARLQQQRAALAQAEKTLREQRAELLRMMAELKQMQDAVRQQQHADLEALRQENAQLRQTLAEREEERADLVQQAAAAPPPVEVQPELVEHLEKAQRQNELLRQLLEEKDALLEELRKQPRESAADAGDSDSYEVEFNQFRRQMESDRERLNDEIEQLRIRNQELDEATREMEMELSRERAELARERTRLDRLREEVRSELERCQRDAGIRDRLAPVQRLREELLDR